MKHYRVKRHVRQPTRGQIQPALVDQIWLGTTCQGVQRPRIMSSRSRSPRSPTSPNHRSSIDSLRDLELTQGSALSPHIATRPLGGFRRPSIANSVISVDFRPELLPLSLSSGTGEREAGDDAPGKTIELSSG